MIEENFSTPEQLEAGLDTIRQSPQDSGRVELIVRRPNAGEREVLEMAELDLAAGLMGDNWLERGSRKIADGSAHPDMQLTLMNSRAIALVARTKDRWPLAGDQLYVDMDLSEDNLPAGSKLRIGTAVIQVTAVPHTGCRFFAARFGPDATQFVNSREGKRLRLRGLNARVLQPGTVRVGDLAIKM
jgi:MOSC domain-containing protein YiiM